MKKSIDISMYIEHMDAKAEQVNQPLFDDLGALPRVDFSIKEIKQAKFNELTNSDRTNIDDRILQFEIVDPNKMWNLHEFYIELEHQLVKMDGTAFTNAEVVSGVARAEVLSSIACMFKSASLYLNDVKMETCNNVFLRGLLLDYLRKRTTESDQIDTSWFYPETDDGENRGRFAIAADATLDAPYDTADITCGSLNARMNRRGPYKRTSIVAGAPTVEEVPYNPSTIVQSKFYLKDMFGYVLDNLNVCVSNRIRVELELCKDGDGVIKGYVATTAATDSAVGRANKCVDAKIKVRKAVMWGDEIVPEDKVKSEILQWLRSGGNFTQIWRQHDVYTSGAPVSEAGGTVTIPITQKYSKLGRVYVFCQSLAKVRGRQTFNRAMFDKLNIKTARLQINGGSVLPNIPFEIDFANRKVSRLYAEFIKAQSAMDPEDSGKTDYHTYMETIPMIVFDCTHIGQALYDQLTKTDLTIEIEFLPTPVLSPYYAPKAAAAGVADREPTTAEDKAYQFYSVVESLRSVTGKADGGVLVMGQLSV